MGLKHFLLILYDIGSQLPVSSATHVQNMLIVEYPLHGAVEVPGDKSLKVI
jgi:hypothetical protein